MKLSATLKRGITSVVAATAVVTMTATPVFAATTTVTKSGVDVTNGSTSQASTGDTIRWTISYENTTGSIVNADLRDALVAPNSYVAGSLNVPAGWTPEWSTDHGTTWVTTEPSPASTVTNVRAVNLFVGTSSTSGSAILPKPNVPLDNSLSESGGDGFQAYFTPSDVCTTFHVEGTGLNVECFNKVTGAVDSNTYVSKTVQTIDRAAPVQDVADNRVFFSVQDKTTSKLALACVDLNSASSPVGCAPTQVLDLGPANANVDTQIVGSRIYVWTGNKFYCVTTAMALCNGGTITTGLTSQPTDDSSIYSDGLLWASAGNSTSAGDGKFEGITCYDPVLGTPCPSWHPTGEPSGTPSGYVNTAHDFPASSGVNAAGSSFLVPLLNSQGVGQGVCSHSAYYAGHWACYNANGTVNTAAAGSLNAFSEARIGVTSNPGLKADFGNPSGSKVFMVYSSQLGSVSGNQLACFDWSTNAGCTGSVGNGSNGGWGTSGIINLPTRPSDTNTSGQEGLYSQQIDPYDPTCLWTDADSGLLRSVDVATGLEGTCKTTATTQVSAAPTASINAAYCDGGTNHVVAWHDVSITGLAPGSAFSDILVTVYDADGIPVPGFENVAAPSGVLDISSIPFSGNTTALTAAVTVRGIPTDLPWPSATPGASISWTGDPVQLCFETTVVNPGSITSFGNHVDTITTPQGQPPITKGADSNTFYLEGTEVPAAGNTGLFALVGAIAVLFGGLMLLRRRRSAA